jgi:hypothetical protein
LSTIVFGATVGSGNEMKLIMLLLLVGTLIFFYSFKMPTFSYTLKWMVNIDVPWTGTSHFA